jgi:hypothetical protein
MPDQPTELREAGRCNQTRPADALCYLEAWNEDQGTGEIGLLPTCLCPSNVYSILECRWGWAARINARFRRTHRECVGGFFCTASFVSPECLLLPWGCAFPQLEKRCTTPDGFRFLQLE